MGQVNPDPVHLMRPGLLQLSALPPLALYVHLPWCIRKCPYCDFNSHVAEGEPPFARYRERLLRDLELDLGHVRSRALQSVFIGGGTPSLMPPATVAAIIDAACQHWTPEPDLEITLEANPSSVEASRFAGFASAGVNRLSLGVQALDDAALKLLGRPHDVAAALAALEALMVASPRFSDAWYERAVWRAAHGQVPAAVEDLLYAEALDPTQTHFTQYRQALQAWLAQQPLPDSGD